MARTQSQTNAASKTAAAKVTAKKAAPAKSTEATKHVVKAGGSKGTAIVALMAAEPALTRTQLAEKVGCTVGRVGETVRWLAANGTAEEKALVAKHVASQPARKVAEKKSTPTKAAEAPAEAKKTAAPRKSRAAKSSEPKQS